MLAGVQLEVFTSLQDGPRTGEQIADAIGVDPARLRLLLYALVAAGLLTEQAGRFANSPEAQHFLVKDTPSYIGYMYPNLAALWHNRLKTAASLRTGIPQAHVDFSKSPPEEVEAFLRRINVMTISTAHALLARYDFSSARRWVSGKAATGRCSPGIWPPGKMPSRGGSFLGPCREKASRKRRPN